MKLLTLSPISLHWLSPSSQKEKSSQFVLKFVPVISDIYFGLVVDWCMTTPSPVLKNLGRHSIDNQSATLVFVCFCTSNGPRTLEDSGKYMVELGEHGGGQPRTQALSTPWVRGRVGDGYSPPP